MESSIPAASRFSLKTQFMVLTLASSLVAALVILQADLAAGAGSGLILLSTVGIGCISGGLLGLLIGKIFNRTKTGVILGLVMAFGSLSCIIALDLVDWYRSKMMELNCCGEISYLTDLAEPFTRIL